MVVSYFKAEFIYLKLSSSLLELKLDTYFKFTLNLRIRVCLKVAVDKTMYRLLELEE